MLPARMILLLQADKGLMSVWGFFAQRKHPGAEGSSGMLLCGLISFLASSEPLGAVSVLLSLCASGAAGAEHFQGHSHTSAAHTALAVTSPCSPGMRDVPVKNNVHLF